MISLMLDLALGRGGGGGCFSCILALGAVCLLCSCCARCKLRDNGCIRWIFRVTGTDAVPDTEMTVIVQECHFTGDYNPTFVRVTAGDEVVETDPTEDGNFQCQLNLFVEQGTMEMLIELMSGSTQLAYVALDLVRDIRINTPNMGFEDQVFNMTETAEVSRAAITMSVIDGQMRLNDAYADLLKDVDEDDKVMVEAQLNKTYRDLYAGDGSHRRKKPSDLELVAKSCAGPVNVYGGWGTRKNVFLAVQAPPQSPDWSLGVWQTEAQYKSGANPSEKISLLRVMSVQPEPARSEVFLINFMVTRTQRQRLVLERVDRSRDVWVELLALCVELVHKERLKRHSHSNHSGRSRSPSPGKGRSHSD